MVTLPTPRRFGFLQRAIAAYCAQTHPSRELVIVLDQGTAEAKAAIVDHVATLGRDDVRLVESPTAMSLGALRNLSRDSARGEVHCQWDDDDLHHPQRVELELAALTASGAQAVCLQEVMLLLTASSEIYWTNWRAAEPTVMPATLMCLATAPARYPESGPRSRLGEDTDVALQFLRIGGLHPMTDVPHLFVYVGHASNTWGAEFHPMLASRLGLSKGLLLRREARIREGLRAIDLGPGQVAVRGPNGVAFTLGV
jgi:glycosyltransferase involved in cell wall biosynthesis